MNNRLTALVNAATRATANKPETMPALLAQLIIEDCIKLCNIESDSNKAWEIDIGRMMAAAEIQLKIKKAYKEND
jgi:hypothetical protein